MFTIEKFLDELLSPGQRQYLGAIEWLLDFNMNPRQGRTFVMAIAFIKMAMRHPGQAVRVFDHHPSYMATENVMRTIYNILSKAHTTERLECPDSGEGLLSRFVIGKDFILYRGINSYRESGPRSKLTN